MRKFFTLMGVLAMLVGQVHAQTRSLSGVVTDGRGAPMTNVSVIARPSGGGTTTNSNGRFTLSVPSSDRTLEFSSINFATQSVAITANSTFDIRLSALDGSLADVVVVGYGTQRRKEITGSIATISGEKLKDAPLQSFEQGLSGRAAGVNVTIPNGVLGNAPIIRVRGTNSISLSSSPLIVIDGVPSFSGDVGSGSTANNLLGDINPSDIESIEVLKDASAAAIYGSRASAGVMLITTKKGRQGRSRVTYDAWAGWTKPYNLLEVLNAEEFTSLKNEALENAGTPANNTTRGFYTMTDASGKVVDTRWADLLYRTGFAHNQTVSVSGANERTNYYFSVGFTDQEGMFRNNNYQRMTGRFTLDHKVNDWLTFGGTFNYTSTKNEGLNTGSTGAAFNTSGAARLAFALSPNVGPYNNDGTYNINTATNSIGQGNNKSALAFTNGVMLLDLNRFTSDNDRFLANVYGQVQLIKGLNFKTLYGVDNLNVVNMDFRNAIHGDGTQFVGAAQNVLQRPRRWNWQNTLNYNATFAELHNVSLLAGTEQQYTNNNSWGADRRRVSDPFFNEYQGGFSEIVPAGNGLSENFLQSYFGRVNYTFGGKYIISGNVRRDGYSAFANKWGNFYGGSMGWVVSEESFWKNAPISNVMNSLRLRSSYGMVGNFAGVGSYASLNLYGSGLYGADPTVVFNQAGNTDLTWEKSKKLDLGFDASFFNNRLNVEFAYFKTDIDDLILNEPQAPSRGIPGNSIATNVGSMVNKGIELTLSGRLIEVNGFSWSSNFNITSVNNRVTTLANNNADILIATGGLESPSLVRVGESLGSFYVVQTDGINPANGQRIFVLRDGTRVQYNHAAPTAGRWTKVADGTSSRAASQSADAVVIGPALPKFIGGFDNTFRYKGFDLNVLLYFSGGNYIYNGTKAGLHDNRNWNNAKDALQRWTKTGDAGPWPRVIFGDNVSNGSALPISNNVEKGDFIKGRNLSLGYTVPAQTLSRIGINSLRVYVAALNAFTITNYSGFDPEIQSNNGGSVTDQVTNAGPSVDRNATSLSRTINFGINVGF